MPLFKQKILTGEWHILFSLQHLLLMGPCNQHDFRRNVTRIHSVEAMIPKHRMHMVRTVRTCHVDDRDLDFTQSEVSIWYDMVCCLFWSSRYHSAEVYKARKYTRDFALVCFLILIIEILQKLPKKWQKNPDIREEKLGGEYLVMIHEAISRPNLAAGSNENLSFCEWSRK